jgi:hypothetical protein
MDRQLIEAPLRQVANSRIDSATDAAQEIMFDAWEERDRERRVAMAHAALKTSPLCADAYVLLAEETAQHPHDAVALYARGVEAGAQALGAAAFKNDVGGARLAGGDRASASTQKNIADAARRERRPIAA